MAEKRSKKQVEEQKEQLANENLRRKANKDMGKIKEDMKVKEAMREAEQKRKGMNSRFFLRIIQLMIRLPHHRQNRRCKS